MSRGCMKKTHERLVATGMPSRVGGVGLKGGRLQDVEGWKRYWGTTDALACGVTRGVGVRGFSCTSRIQGEFEIIESESGAVTRQVIDNDITYSMPEFVEYPVRDRASWEFWKERMTPADLMPLEEMREKLSLYDARERPLAVGVSGTYGFLRGLLGPERLGVMFFDDPGLIRDMMEWRLERTRDDLFPDIESLRPDIVQMGDDLCYRCGMLVSPKMFHEFCGPYYREVCGLAQSCGVSLIAVDTDGNLMEFAGVAASCGVNGLFPCEAKAGNVLFSLRRQFPSLVLFGWLEKEVVNEGNEGLIEPEILGKVPSLLLHGRYFPNGDHGIQPLVTFRSLCRFMTILHEVCGNPEGEFPRI